MRRARLHLRIPLTQSQISEPASVRQKNTNNSLPLPPSPPSPTTLNPLSPHLPVQGHGGDRLPGAKHRRRPDHQLFVVVTILPSVPIAATTTASRCGRRLLLRRLLLLSSGRVSPLHELGQLPGVHLARRRQRRVAPDAALP